MDLDDGLGPKDKEGDRVGFSRDLTQISSTCACGLWLRGLCWWSGGGWRMQQLMVVVMYCRRLVEMEVVLVEWRWLEEATAGGGGGVLAAAGRDGG